MSASCWRVCSIRDPRILDLLTERLEFDAHDTLMLLEVYGDPAAIPALEEFENILEEEDQELRQGIDALEESLQSHGFRSAGRG